MAAAKSKSRWTDRISSSITVLNHAESLALDRFTSEDLDQIVGCDDVQELSLRSSKMADPVDLARIAHITGLRYLRLDRLRFTNLKALRALPRLRHISMDGCAFSNFEDLNGFEALESLYLFNSKLTAFPAGLDLPRLESLIVSGGRLTDLSFVQSYPRLARLSVKGNQVRDLSPLAACPWVVDLEVHDNPVASLAPLAGRQFTRFYADAPHREEQQALQLLLPEEPYVPDPAHAEAWRVADLMQAKDWQQLYAITDLALLGEAFFNLAHSHYDEETVRGVLAHPAEGAFHAMVAKGLRPHYSVEAELLVGVLGSYGERTIAPLTECFYTALARHPDHDDFAAGKLESEHAMVMRILLQVAGPAYTELFLAFFNEREGFSEAHLHHYKKLLDVVGKTGAPQLVEPTIDLLRFEKHIVGGDAAFMKKVFKAIGQLGSKADAAVLASRFDAAAEARADVLEAYEATLARLAKKKA
ncbi:hypothetical protein PMI14_02204 [Acidovorax sp. CF316]|uniref:leucine-rich repeat domain-containing protein n=1 Tax=Acidovorax sp. CF316 TaxID=1144317 RepID=UPI00026BC6EA|nr:hypothetical protein [Acidovorax sp. CF316]EJE53130.1 hypothetical protein PMI14_02204 [Acidovorax sp. CF316]